LTSGALSATTGAFSSTVTGGTYNGQTISSVASLTGSLTVAGATTLSSTVSTGALSVTGAATYTTNLKSTTALATPSALSATQATEFASTVSGAAIMGFGTTNDVSLMNRAGTVVLGVGPNTTTVNMTGLLTVSGLGQSTFSAGGNSGNSIRVENTSAGTAAVAAFNLRNDETWNGGIRALSSTFTTSGPDVASGMNVHWNGSAGLSVASTHASGEIRFYSGGTTVRGGFNAAGQFYVGTAANSTVPLSVTFSAANQSIASLINSSATAPHGVYVKYSATSPNTTDSEFFRGDDNAAMRFAVRSNGGIANFQANDVNLSDASTKEIAGLLGPQRESFRRLSFIEGRYRDAPSTALTAMLTAQNVQQVYPDAVTEFSDGKLGVREHDIVMRAFKVLQELDAVEQQHDKELFDNGVSVIQQLAARIAALETKDH
jgi:hypothetical protein